MADSGNPIEKLKPTQRRAIVALLSEPNVKAAAKAAQVGERTLHRWLVSDMDFVLFLREAESNAINHVTRQLVRLADKATETIENTLADEGNSAGVRLRAAGLILENLLRLRELATLEARILALEAAMSNESQDAE